MKITLVDFHAEYASQKSEINKAIAGVFSRGIFILGEEVKRLEREFASYTKCSYGIGVASGTDALSIALRCVGVKQNDKVVIPANAYPTVFAVSSIGAIPVLCDVDPRTFTFDISKLKNVVDSKTKAIIPVHLYGQPADMDGVLSVAKRYGVPVVEDAAQAHGALYKGVKVGSIGDLGCFSFYPTKNLGAYGDGGMIVSKKKMLSEKAMLWRMYGEKTRYQSVLPGTNSRLDEIQAAMLLVKLRSLPKWNKRRNELATLYREYLKDFPEIVLPYQSSDVEHVYHLFVIRCKKRDQLMKFLAQKNISSAVHYPKPIHLQKSFKYLGYSSGAFPVSEKASKEILSLPIHPFLKDEHIRYVCKQIKLFFHEKSA